MPRRIRPAAGLASRVAALAIAAASVAVASGARIGAQDPAPPAVPALPASGFGIAGMRERAALLGGTLAAGPLPPDRFRVHARLPLDPETP